MKITKLLLLFFCCIAQVGFLKAIPVKSIHSGSWYDGSTWDKGAIPTKFDKVTIATGTTVSVYGAYTDCDSLIIDGFLDVGGTNLTIGGRDLQIDNRAIRNTSCIVNGKLRIAGDWEHQFKVYGNVKFNTGSTFEMPSGTIMIDGCAFTEALSVPADKALLDVTDATHFNASGGLIVLFNPHYFASGIAIKGAKHFAAVSFGNNLTLQNFALRAPSDFNISETDKPTFGSVQLAYLPNPQRQNRVILNNMSIRDLTITKGVVVGAGRLKIAGEILIGPEGQIETDIEMNGAYDQKISTFLSNTNATIKGNFFINTAYRVVTKLNIEIEKGTLQFLKGRIDLEGKTLTLNSAPLGMDATRYIISHNGYWGTGTVKIKNLSSATIFPVGTETDYLPVTLTASAGDFSVSAHPLSIFPNNDYFSINTQWEITRLTGNALADVQVQWNNANETYNFSTYRNNANLYHYENGNWQPFGNPTGISTSNGVFFTKNVPNINSFSAFTVLTRAGQITYDCPTLFKNIGDTCDDGNLETINDRVQADCACRGTIVVKDCPTLNKNKGDTCDDGNSETTNDRVQADCTCRGTVVAKDCPTLNKNIGDVCDDGIAETVNDRIQANCTCRGIVPTNCTQYTGDNTNQICSPSTWKPFALQLGNELIKTYGLTFQKLGNGTALIKGIFRDNTWTLITVDILLQGYNTTGKPVTTNCLNENSATNDWFYYSTWSGTIQRGNAPPLSILGTSAMQIGTGANTYNIDALGAYGRFSTPTQTGFFTFKLTSPISCTIGNESLVMQNTMHDKPIQPQIFPNPAQSYIDVLLSETPEADVTITVINVLGSRLKTVKTKYNSLVHIDIADLPNGIYLLKVSEMGKMDFLRQMVVRK